MMPTEEDVYVRAKLSRGGFSSERIFRLELADGAAYVGAAPVEYCFNRHQEPLGSDDPPPGKALQGLISARIVSEEEDGTFWVNVPSGEVIRVRPGSVIRQPAEI